MADIIATEQDVYDITSTKATSFVANRCATKAQAVAMGADSSKLTAYADTQLVCKKDIAKKSDPEPEPTPTPTEGNINIKSLTDNTTSGILRWYLYLNGTNYTSSCNGTSFTIASGSYTMKLTVLTQQANPRNAEYSFTAPSSGTIYFALSAEGDGYSDATAVISHLSGLSDSNDSADNDITSLVLKEITNNSGGEFTHYNLTLDGSYANDKLGTTVELESGSHTVTIEGGVNLNGTYCTFNNSATIEIAQGEQKTCGIYIESNGTDTVTSDIKEE